MEFLELAKKRCSTRSFLRRNLTQAEIDYLLEAAQVAPTNGNIQNFHIYVVSDEALLGAFSEYAQVYNAPCVFAVSYDESQMFRPSINANDSGLIDTSVIITHMMLAATDLELGSVWINYFKQEEIEKLLKTKPHETVAHLLAVGYPNVPFKDSDRHEKERKPLSELVTYKNKND